MEQPMTIESRPISRGRQAFFLLWFGQTISLLGSGLTGLAISAIFRAMLIPAFSAVTTLLVPKEQFGRASGLVQTAFGIQQLLAPLLAGVLLGLIRLQGIFLIDVITFLFAIGTLLIVRIPR